MQTEVWVQTDADRFDHVELAVTIELRSDGWHVLGGQADGEVWPTLVQARRAVYRS